MKKTTIELESLNYAAKEEFSNFTLNEAEIKIESVSDEEWNARKAEVDRLHQN